MAEKEVKEFMDNMKEEFARIPKNLSIDELRERSERCNSLAETFRASGERFKAKKYQLLSQKYKQLELEKRNPRPQVKETSPIFEEPTIIQEPAKKSRIATFFLKIFGKKKEN